MKTVTVKDLVIGTGAPKIIVSLMAKDIARVKSEALAYREADFDILECVWTTFADLSNVESVMAAAKILRETMPEKPLLFTFRSAKEGGEQAISTEAYIVLQSCTCIDSGLVDMIDLELFTGDDQVKETVAYAHAHDAVPSCPTMTSIKRRKPKKSLPVCAKCSPSTPIFLRLR